MEISEESWVIQNPVERRGAEDEIDRFAESGRIEYLQICLSKGNLIAKPGGQKRPGFVQHVLGAVDGNHATSRKSLKQFRSQSPSAATTIESRFMTVGVKKFERACTPGLVGVGNAMIDLGIPLGSIGGS